jgi:BolA protein
MTTNIATNITTDITTNISTDIATNITLGIKMTIAVTIEQKLLSAFSPMHLDVINESHKHNVAPGSESHFKVIIVAKEFEDQRLIKRHRAVNAILAEELSAHIHALALHTYTEKEWHDYYQAHTPLSPNCLGGGK